MRTILWMALLPAAAVLAGPAGEIRPHENLLADCIPAIPDSLAESVSRYTEFRSAGVQSWHPLKREMLITTRFGDTNQVHLVRMPGGARRQLTFFADRVGRASYEPAKGAFFVFSKDTGGTSSASSTVTTFPPERSRCSPTARRRTGGSSGPGRATASPTGPPGGTGRTATCTSRTRGSLAATGSWRTSTAAAGRPSIGASTTAGSSRSKRSPPTRATSGSSTS